MLSYVFSTFPQTFPLLFVTPHHPLHHSFSHLLDISLVCNQLLSPHSSPLQPLIIHQCFLPCVPCTSVLLFQSFSHCLSLILSVFWRYFMSTCSLISIFCSLPLLWISSLPSQSVPFLSFCISCFTCTLHSQPPPGQSVHQTPGVCGFLAATAVSMTTAGCGGKRWGSVGCGWLHPPVLPWCFPLCGTSLWWGDCCLLAVTTNQLVSPVLNGHKHYFTKIIRNHSLVTTNIHTRAATISQLDSKLVVELQRLVN